MLATARPLPPTADQHGLEVKWDGFRCGARRGAEGQVRLDSRSGKPLVDSFPEIAEALADALPGRRVSLDGELVVAGPNGVPRFERLQQRMGSHPSPVRRERHPVSYVVFDLLDLDGESTVDLPYERRRALLSELGLHGPRLSVPDYYTNIDPRTLMTIVDGQGLEGLVIKRMDSQYRSGRSSAWTKHAIRKRLSVIIAGYRTDRDGTGTGLGALLVARPTTPPRGRTRFGLDFVGSVGTGWSAALGRRIIAQLAPRASSPFSRAVPAQYTYRVHWVDPVVICDIDYRMFTAAGVLRHASWAGLRPDLDVPDLLTLATGGDDRWPGQGS